MSAPLHASPQSVVGPAPTDVLGARAWLAGSVRASAAAAADESFAGLRGLAVRGGSPADLAQHLEERGLAPLLGWADAVALAGLDREPWARDAALGAVRAFAGRLRDLMARAAEEGRS